LIWFDNLRVHGTPSYYVQQLFCCNRGDVLLPTILAGAPTATNQQPRLYASASREEKAGVIILKAVNASPERVLASLRFQGLSKLASAGTRITLTSPQLSDENSLTEPLKVAPAKSRLSGVAAEFSYGFEPYSLTVLRLPVAR
jgi:alpha-N-arabinofuranosidase